MVYSLFLLYPKTRLYAFVAVIIFHLATTSLFYIGIFPWVMIAASPIFFVPFFIASASSPYGTGFTQVIRVHDPKPVKVGLSLMTIISRLFKVE